MSWAAAKPPERRSRSATNREECKDAGKARLFNSAMHKGIVVGIGLLCLGLTPGVCQAREFSELWGENGEKWSPVGRLPDFSHAGYHDGEAVLPKIPQVLNVKDFGAVGDGKHDDTQAFMDAIAEGKKGAIFVPPGRYLITRIVEIKKSGIVLRGAGSDKSVLVCPVPLETIRSGEPRPSSSAEARPFGYTVANPVPGVKVPSPSPRSTVIQRSLFATTARSGC